MQILKKLEKKYDEFHTFRNGVETARFCMSNIGESKLSIPGKKKAVVLNKCRLSGIDL